MFVVRLDPYFKDECDGDYSKIDKKCYHLKKQGEYISQLIFQQEILSDDPDATQQSAVRVYMIL